MCLLLKDQQEQLSKDCTINPEKHPHSIYHWYNYVSYIYFLWRRYYEFRDCIHTTYGHHVFTFTLYDPWDLQKYKLLFCILSIFLFRHISVGVFCHTAMFLDTLSSSILATSLSPEYGSCQSRRSEVPQHRLRICSYPYKWMILSSCMIICSRQTHPGSLVAHSITSTIRRMYRIYDIIHCSPGVLW